jgi:hypothetical protein
MTALAMPPDDVMGLVEVHRQQAQDALTEPARLAAFCDPKFNRRPHLDLISREIARLATGETKRLMIMVPPQTGKSTLAAVWAPFWWLARNPDHRIIVASYGNALAVSRGKQIRRLVQRQGWRYSLDVEWGSGTVNDWQLTSGGGVRSAGVGSGLTGFPASCAFLDDPVRSRADAESRTMRDHVWDWYSAEFLSRLAPDAPMMIIGTPWHADDLQQRVLKQDGRVEEGGAWRVVRLPALADVNDPLGREFGEPLTHPKIEPWDTTRLLEFWETRRRSTTARDWVSLYQCDPKPVVGKLVTEDVMRQRTFTPPPAKPVKTAVGVDPSGGGRDIAGIIAGFLGDDGRVYLTHDVSVVGPSEQWSKAVVYLAAEVDAEFIVFEKNFGGDMAGQIIKAAWKTAQQQHPGDARFTRPAPMIRSVVAKKNKVLRAEPVAQAFIDDHARLGANLPDLIAEWTTYVPTDKDSPGRIDASTHLALALFPEHHEPAKVAAHPAMLGGTRGVVPGNPYLGSLPGVGPSPGRRQNPYGI